MSLLSRLLYLSGFHPPVAEPDGRGGVADVRPVLLPPEEQVATWTSDGWYQPAERSLIHPGRIGGKIRPWAAVVHTTDMHPDRFAALLKRWKKVPGEGAGAHFLIGCTTEDGLHQLVPINRNANHAGGRTHGNFVRDGVEHHPNNVSIGIEVMNAGRLHWVGGEWRTLGKDKIPFGRPFDEGEVSVGGPHRYHLPTEYQKRTLVTLLRDFSDSLPIAAPAWTCTTSKREDGYYPRPAWAPYLTYKNLPVVGHVTLTPDRKDDPHYPLSAYLTFALS